ncbi:triacylglycerol lipase-like protein [Monoraphidium neglectum]|uniref:Triacylglycerol lipase-like protein n=1 Tax=Monoraphidium neglectum TaxID=145388 RepID=A0A0D2LWL3_9CHLO|nr:triacylglycerol lipase-like protein [Monoraphidium neglectum]KIY93941.1 triacylglycerol lipase-like protein [Monoraphidium neglectum]|eukprot:XP_013892961.1 triacylglycerol lipase-like protein [Monoraphidium neglectum]
MASCSPFSELAVQATSELLPLEPQDLQHATVLCEAVYCPDDAEARREVRALSALMGAQQQLTDVTLHDAAGQRYIVGHSPTAMFVCFQGTKYVKDWIANLSFRHATMWAGDDKAKAPAAHCGFSGRSVAVPLDELYAKAQAANKRLVLCGHSLGGAVALVCAIKLLRVWAARQLGGSYAPGDAACAGGGRPPAPAPRGRRERRARRQQRDSQHLAAAAAAAAAAPFADPDIRCITFAAPAVANESLAAEVVAAGWDRLMCNFLAIP